MNLEREEENSMEFALWKRYYLEIVKFFGFDLEKDEEAASLLGQLVDETRIAPDEDLRRMIEGNKVFVFGGGLSVRDQIKEYDIDGVLISADSATSALVENGMQPDIIVSDLDGNVQEQVDLNNKGAIMLVHAHGDNMPALKEWVGQFKGKVVPTCQSEPYPPLRNYGGFTDGDRAIFLADHFNAKAIFLVGFDFQGASSAFKEMDETKFKKLSWAQLLIAMLDNPTIQFIDEDRPIMSFGF